MALVLAGFTVLAVVMTFPLAFHPGTLGYRLDYGDSQFSIWNVGWVAHALATDPRHVLDANIFYPHQRTLTYSETNLGAGALALPIFALTGNVYAAHNFVVFLSFVLSGIGMYALVRYLVHDRMPAIVAAVTFAYCPHVFAHLPHVQLLMTAGLPFGLLAFHRLADRPTAGRGALLGVVLGVEALFCAYYAVFLVLMVGYAVLFTAAWRGAWRDARFWRSVATAAIVSAVIVLPLFAAYVTLQRSTGFSRSLASAAQYSADWRAYFASSSYAHSWMLPLLGRWQEVLFPGFVALICGVAGVLVGWRDGSREREVSVLYGSAGLLALWESFGPDAGLYRVSYFLIPAFGFMRAPSRFGLLVAFSLAVLSAFTVRRLLRVAPKPRLTGAFQIAIAAAELIVPLAWGPVPMESEAYRQLAVLPRGAVLELPVYSEQFAFARTRYMLSSTVHWMPLVDAYSDYIPQDFRDAANVLGDFPTKEAFALLERDRVRYAVFHVDKYGAAAEDLHARIAEFSPFLRRIYADRDTWLYEITGSPR